MIVWLNISEFCFNFDKGYAMLPYMTNSH